MAVTNCYTYIVHVWASLRKRWRDEFWGLCRFILISLYSTQIVGIMLLYSTVRVTIKFPLDSRTYARFSSNGTPVSVPIVHPYPYLSNARLRSRRTPIPVDIISTPVAKYACFRKAPNQYQKVQIVRYVRGAINMLLLAFRVIVCVTCCVLFRVFIHRGLCLQRFKMVYSDYVKHRILVYYRCKKNCTEIACCLTPL